MRDSREEILRRCEDYAERNFRIEWEKLPERIRERIFRSVEQDYRAEQQATFEFYHEDR